MKEYPKTEGEIKMKKQIVSSAVLSALVLGVPHLVVHANDDNILVDNANMLKSGEKESIQKDIQNVKEETSYTFHVVTEPELNGKDVKDVTIDTFKKWNLGDQDILFLVSLKERKVYMQTNPNSEISKMFQQKGFKDYIDTHFVPSAKENQYAKGISKSVTALPNFVSEMKPAATSSSNEASREESDFLNTFLSALGVAILLAGGIASIVFYASRKKEKNRIKRKWDTTMNHYKKFEHDFMVTKNTKETTGLIEGETKEGFKDVTSQLEKMEENVLFFKKQLEGMEVGLFNVNKLSNELDIFNKKIKEENYELSYLNQSITKLVVLVKHYQKDKTDLEHALILLQENIRNTESKYSLNLSTFTLKVNAIETEYGKTKETFDPLKHKEVFKDLTKRLEFIKKEFSELENIIANAATLETEIISSKEKEKYLMEKEAFLPKHHPDNHFKDPKALVTDLQNHLKNGSYSKVHAVYDSIREIMKNRYHSLQILQTQKLQGYKLTQDVQKELPNIIAGCKEAEGVFDGILKQAKEEYKANVVDQLATMYADVKHFAQTIQNELPKVVEMQKDTVQDYAKAYDTVQYLKKQADKFAFLQKDVVDAYDRLERRKSQIQDKLNEFSSKLDGFRVKIRTNQLPFTTFQYKVQKVEGEIGNITFSLSQKPIALDELEKQVFNMKGSYSSLEREIQSHLDDKRRAEEQLERHRRRYQQSYNRFSGKVSRSRYDSSYNSSNIENLIASGLFLQAIDQLNADERTISIMEKDYNSAVAEESRQSSYSRNSNYDSPSGGGSTWGSNNDTGGSYDSSGGGGDF